MAADEARPTLLTLPWPSSCQTRFKKEGRGAFLPPVLALVLFAEMARHAQGQAAHNIASFDRTGRPIDLKTVREDIATAASGSALAATTLMLRSKWLQTSAMLAPARILQEKNHAAAIAWTDECEQLLLEFAHDAGRAGAHAFDEMLRPVVSPKLGTEAEFAKRDFLAHPNVWAIDRADGTSAFPNRQAVTFYGMTSTESASVALRRIADQARKWNKQHCHASPLRERWSRGRPSLPRSIAAITYCWLETNVPETLCRKYHRAGQQSCQDDLRDLSISAEDLVMAGDSGRDLDKVARRICALLPQAGVQGSSRFSNAALWIERQSDDVDVYRKLARRSARSIDELNVAAARRAQPGNIPGEVVLAISLRGLGKARRPDRRGYLEAGCASKNPMSPKDIELAARVAQAEAMLMGPSATDPMHAVFLRERKKAAALLPSQ